MVPRLGICLFALAIIIQPSPSDPAKILGVFPFENWSHTQFFLPLMKELASRGHQVTVISHIVDQKESAANYTAISLHGLIPLCGNVTIEYVANLGILDGVFQDILDIGITGCDIILNSDIIRQFNQSDATFDVVIVEIFNTDCFIPFAHRFNAPLIAASSSAPYPWYSDRLGMSNNPSYISSLLSSFGSKMSFWGRLCNSVTLLAMQVAYKLYYIPAVERIAREFFGPGMPPLADQIANTSLLLLNTHPSFSPARPVPPGVIQVAGLNLKAPRPLPQDLEEFISGAKHGVVYFSLGSILDGSSFKPDKKQAIIDTFAALPQRVLWRSDEEPTSLNLPSNVKMVHWLPQPEILRHPNTKLFITHGGLFSLIEALSTATPVLGMPLFADQFDNMKTVEEAGVGLSLRYPQLTKDHLYHLITTLLNDKRYAENAKAVSNRFNDRPMSAMDTAVYWVEYVIRHKGAPHLKSQAVNLPWYQLYLVDVILFLVVLATVIVILIKMSLNFIFIHLPKTTKKKHKLS